MANTLAAVREGAMQVQGTINGYGERCGNANLCSIIPDLELKLNLRCLPDGALADAVRGVPLRGRGRQPGARRAPGLRRQVRVCAQGRHPRGRHAAHGADLPAHRSGAGRQPDARGGERAVRARQPAEQGGGIRARTRARRQSGRRVERDQGARGPGLCLRGRRSLRGHDDEAAGAGLRGAVRAHRLHGERRASAGARHLLRGHGQGARAGFGRSACTPPPRATAR